MVRFDFEKPRESPWIQGRTTMVSRMDISKLHCLTIGVAVLMSAPFWSEPAEAAVEQSVRESLVEVRGVNRIKREYPIAAGFVVNSNGFVVTVAQQALVQASKVVVAPLFGAGATFEVTQSQFHPSLELAVLHAPGLRRSPISLGDAHSKWQNVLVPLKRDDQFAWSRGRIGSFVMRPVQAYDQTKHRFITHNADLESPMGYGTPLLDEQGRVVGVNHRNPDLGIKALSRKIKPEGKTFAVPASDLASFLKSRNIVFEAAQMTNTSSRPPFQDDTRGRAVAESLAPPVRSQPDLEDARARLEREREARLNAEAAARSARQKAHEMARLANEAESRSAASEQEKEAARQAARTASAEAEVAEKSAQDAQRRADEAEKMAKELEDRVAAEVLARKAADEDAEKTRRNLIVVVVIGAVVVLILLVAWFAYSRRSSAKLEDAEVAIADARDEAKIAQQVAADAIKPAPFACLLEGRASKNRRFTVKIPADALGAADGVILGRNPRHSAIVIDDKNISREHAKLTVADDKLYIEDLNSTNGTFVNNAKISAGQRMAVHSGFVVGLGPISFKVTLS